jgi:hypothetical protein
MAASSTDNAFARVMLAYDCFRRSKLAEDDLRKVCARMVWQKQKQKQKDDNRS